MMRDRQDAEDLSIQSPRFLKQKQDRQTLRSAVRASGSAWSVNARTVSKLAEIKSTRPRGRSDVACRCKLFSSTSGLCRDGGSIKAAQGRIVVGLSTRVCFVC